MVKRWPYAGIDSEAGPCQTEKLVREKNLDGAKSLGTPGTNARAVQCEGGASLPLILHSSIRAIAACAD